jgi:hypothetical protein
MLSFLGTLYPDIRRARSSYLDLKFKSLKTKTVKKYNNAKGRKKLFQKVIKKAQRRQGTAKYQV